MGICQFKEKVRALILTSKFVSIFCYSNTCGSGHFSHHVVRRNMLTDWSLLSTCCCRFYYGRVTPNPHNPDLRSAPTLKPKKSGTGSFDECVQSGDPHCTYTTGSDYDLTIPYFCGQEKWCMWVHCNSLSNMGLEPQRWITCRYWHCGVQGFDVTENGGCRERRISFWTIYTQKQKVQNI